MGICLPCMDFAMWEPLSLPSSCLRHPSLPWTILLIPLFIPTTSLPFLLSSLHLVVEFICQSSGHVFDLFTLKRMLFSYIFETKVSLGSIFSRNLILWFCFIVAFKIKTLPLLIWYSVQGPHLYLCITQSGFCQYIETIKILNYISILNTY